MTAAEIQQLLAETKKAGSLGKFERFKTAKQFDGQYHRRQHGA
jgi:hypothetical protein